MQSLHEKFQIYSVNVRAIGHSIRDIGWKCKSKNSTTKIKAKKKTLQPEIGMNEIHLSVCLSDCLPQYR